MSDEQTIGVAAVVGYPFAVTDAALGEFFQQLPKDMQWRWEGRTSGSSVHHVTKEGTELYHIVVRAMSANKTSLVLGAIARSIVEPGEQTKQFGMTVISQFAVWFRQDQTNLQYLSPPEPSDQATALARRQRKSHPEDDWAWEQVNVVKRKPDEVRAEWELRAAHRNLIDPGRSFRHAVNPGRRIKRSTIPPS